MFLGMYLISRDAIAALMKNVLAISMDSNAVDWRATGSGAKVTVNDDHSVDVLLQYEGGIPEKAFTFPPDFIANEILGDFKRSSENERVSKIANDELGTGWQLRFYIAKPNELMQSMSISDAQAQTYFESQEVFEAAKTSWAWFLLEAVASDEGK